MALIDRFSSGTDDIDQRRLSLGEHLEELRRHVFRAVGFLLAAMVIALCFQDRLMNWATWPHRKIMEQLTEEATFRDAFRNLPSGVVRDVKQTLAGTEDLEKDVRALDRNAAILKEKLESDPRQRIQGLSARQAALETRIHALRDEQEQLLGAPDAVKFQQLESERRAIAADAAVLSQDVRKELAPISETGDVRIPRYELIQLRYTEGFMAYLKVSLVCAVFIASPLIGRELWKFVAAGLHRHEKYYVRIFAPITFVAFIIGASFGYYILIPAGLKFLATYGAEYIAGTFALSDYLSLFIGLTLMVGLVFELPLVMAFVALLGFMTPQAYASYRRYWVLVAFVLAAVISPTPDPITQCLCAGPLLVLYEIGILASRWVVWRKQRAKAQEGALVP